MSSDRGGSILCFGEVLLRLSAERGAKLVNAQRFDTSTGGSEANVGALLAQLGHPVEMVTVLPRSSLGDQCEAELRRVGIGTSHSVRVEGRQGIYFLEGAGAAGRIIYDRGGSAFAQNANLIDWSALVGHASWFHLSGIDLALGDIAAEAALDAVKTMANAGVTISFDVNHRASLWEGRSKSELARVRDVMALTDYLFASPRDLARTLGCEVAQATQSAFGTFDRLKLIASTQRLLQQHRLSVRIATREQAHETNGASLGCVVDRIGSGDAFAGAVIDAILRRASLEESANSGLAAAVSKHGIAGDRWIGTREELESFNPFSPGDVRR
jgi:2-dehydro-3-deoxygluconokinase